MSRVIGVTGTIGSGKSTVGAMLAEMGCHVIDTDAIVHSLLTSAGPVRGEVVRRFGAGILQDNGSGAIDRKKLGDIVFQDPRLRRELEELVHPAVLKECEAVIGKSAGAPLVVVLVPLLFEAKLEGRFDEVWVVTAAEAALVERLQTRDNLSKGAIEARLSAQMPQEEKARRAQRVIDNSGSLESTRRQVQKCLEAALAGSLDHDPTVSN